MKVAGNKTPAATQTAKNTTPFFNKEGGQDTHAATTEQPFFSKATTSTGIQTKLTVGKPNDPYEREADSMADKVVQRLAEPAVQKKSDKPAAAGITPLVQTKTNTAGVPAPATGPTKTSTNGLAASASSVQAKANTTPEKPVEKEDEKEFPATDNLQRKPIFESNAEPEDTVQRKCRECEEGDEVWTKPAGSIQRANLNDNAPTADGSRDSIVAMARTMIGKIEAKHDDGSGKRVGADKLLEIFHLAAPGVWDDSTVENIGGKLPAWCGIFTVWAHKKAGKDIGTWQMGKGVSAFGTLTQTTSPQPGDIGYIDEKLQHHCIVVKIEGDMVHSIDGNSGNFSEVKENQKPLKDYLGFFTAFAGGGGATVQTKSAADAVQAKSDDTTTASPAIEQQLSSSKGGGTSLPESTRQTMEQSFGADFSNVKVHTDSSAVQMSSGLNAQAFTHGSDIYFNTGKYNPQSTGGQHLLAHELTHTVQQGGAQAKKSEFTPATPSVQRANTPVNVVDRIKSVTKPPASGDTMVVAPGDAIEIHLVNFPLKSYVETLPPNGTVKPPKGTDRKTNQRPKWNTGTTADVKTSLEKIYKPQNENELLSLNSKEKGKTKNTQLLGTIKELAGEINVPFWDVNGTKTTHEVEHMVDVQILGSVAADVITNMVLIDDDSNGKLKDQVMDALKAKVGALLKHYQIPPEITVGIAMTTYKVIFDSFAIDPKLKVKSIIRPGDFKKDGAENPINAERVSLTTAKVPEDSFVLKTSKEGVSYILPKNFKSEFLETKWDEKGNKLESATFLKSMSGKNDVIKDIRPTPLKFEEVAGQPKTFKVDAGLQGAAGIIQGDLKMNHLSPIKLNDDFKLDPKNGPSFSASIVTKVKPLEKAKIDLFVENGDFGVRASISGDQFKLPSPFSINYCAVELGATAQKGFYASGEVGFGIKQIGEGRVKATGNSNGFSVSGEFNLDKKLFDGKVEVNYSKKKDEEEGEWSIKGSLDIPKEGKLTGVKSLHLEFTKDNDSLKGDGNVKLNVPGINEVTIHAEATDKGALNIEGTVDFKDIPKVKGATGTLTLSKPEGATEWDIGIKGQVKPNIEFGGLKMEAVDIGYKKGFFDIIAKGSFEKGRVHGDFTLGATNKPVKDGVKSAGDPGKPGKEMSYFAEGELKVLVADGLEATIKVKVKESGDILISGKLALEKDKELLPGKKDDKEEREKGDPLYIFGFLKTIPIASCGVASLNLGLTAGIGLFYDFEGLKLDKGTNLEMHEVSIKDMSKVALSSTISLSTRLQAGVNAYIGAVAELAVLIAKVRGTGTINLKLSAIDAKATAKVLADFSAEKGLQFREASLNFELFSRIRYGIKLSIALLLDLWLTEITLWSNSWKPDALQGEKAFKMFSGKLDLPLKFGDKNSLSMDDTQKDIKGGLEKQANNEESYTKASNRVVNDEGPTEEETAAESQKTIKEDLVQAYRGPWSAQVFAFNSTINQDYYDKRIAIWDRVHEIEVDQNTRDLLINEIKRYEFEEYEAFGVYLSNEKSFDAETKKGLVEEFIDNRPTLGSVEKANLMSLIVMPKATPPPPPANTTNTTNSSNTGSSTSSSSSSSSSSSTNSSGGNPPNASKNTPNVSKKAMDGTGPQIMPMIQRALIGNTCSTITNNIVQLSPLSTQADDIWNTTKDKGKIFDLLRTNSPGAKGDGDLRTCIERLFAQGSDDRWLALAILDNGPEPLWPDSVIAERARLAQVNAWPEEPGHIQGSLGTTAGGRAVDSFFFPGKTDHRALIVGGFHGSELSGIKVTEILLEKLRTGPRPYYTVIIVPRLFPDNAARAEADPKQIATTENVGRYTSGSESTKHSTDPNRQMPKGGEAYNPGDAKDSKGRPIEAENVMLLELIERFKPTRIAAVHSTHGLNDAGIYADPRTDSTGVAQGYDSDEALAIEMAKVANAKGAKVPGDKLDNKNPNAIYPSDAAPAKAGAKQKRKTDTGISLGGWGSTAVCDPARPGANRDAMRIITIEVQKGHRPEDMKDTTTGDKAKKAARQAELEGHADALREIFLGPTQAEVASAQPCPPPPVTPQSPPAVKGGTLQKMIQRTEAEDLIDEHTSWGDLDEPALGQALVDNIHLGYYSWVGQVLDELGSTDRDDVAYEISIRLTNEQMDELMIYEAARAMLDRLFDELTAGSIAEEEQREADRIIDAKSRAIPTEEFPTSLEGIKIFPFREPGMTVLNDAPMNAERRTGGRIWVNMPVRVLGTDQFRGETSTLPTEVFLGGIELPENEIIGVRLYDLGDVEPVFKPALFLVQLANQTDTAIASVMAEVVGIGLTMGIGEVVALGVEASMAARVLLWADRAAFVLGTLTTIINEHRGWILSTFGEDGRTFLSYNSLVQRATAIYGVTRAVYSLGSLMNNFRRSYSNWRVAADGMEEITTEQSDIVRAIENETEGFLQNTDDMRAARRGPASAGEEAVPTVDPTDVPEPSRPGRTPGGRPAIELPEEVGGFCSLGSINCRTVPPRILDEVDDYPMRTGGYDVPYPGGNIRIMKSALTGVDRDTALLRQVVLDNEGLWSPQFRRALARAERDGLDWPVDAAGNPWEVHHVKPVNMGGGNDPGNLLPLPRSVHQVYSNWWNALLRRFRVRFSDADWASLMHNQTSVPGSRVPTTPP